MKTQEAVYVDPKKMSADDLQARIDELKQAYDDCLGSEYGGTVAMADGIAEEIEYFEMLLEGAVK